jgi:hypothetical protein
MTSASACVGVCVRFFTRTKKKEMLLETVFCRGAAAPADPDDAISIDFFVVAAHNVATAFAPLAPAKRPRVLLRGVRRNTARWD